MKAFTVTGLRHFFRSIWLSTLPNVRSFPSTRRCEESPPSGLFSHLQVSKKLQGIPDALKLKQFGDLRLDHIQRRFPIPSLNLDAFAIIQKQRWQRPVPFGIH